MGGWKGGVKFIHALPCDSIRPEISFDFRPEIAFHSIIQAGGYAEKNQFIPSGICTLYNLIFSHVTHRAVGVVVT